MFKKHSLLILLIIGSIFRVFISFNTYSGDLTNHMIWGEDAVKHGLQGLYERNFEKIYGHTSPNYPPLIILIFAILYLLKNLVYQIAWLLNLHVSFFPSNLIFFLRDFDYFPYLLKLPAIFADIGIAYITYLFFKKNKPGNEATSQLATVFVLFNPAYFYNSAYWGQTDSLPLFFLLVSFYALIYQKKIFFSAILFILGLLSKQTVVIFIPLYLMLLYQSSSLKILVKTFLVSLIFFCSFFLPFYQKGNLLTFPFSTYLNKILLSPGIPYTSNHAFNIWYLLTGSRKTLASSNFNLNVSYEIWGFFAASLLIILVLLKLIKSRFQPKNIFYAGFLIPLTSFLFLTKMHERHLILTLPFLLLISYDNKLLLISYIFISLFNFFNMYHNWWSPEISILKNSLSNNQIINFLTIFLIIFYFFSLLNYSGLSSKNKKNLID